LAYRVINEFVKKEERKPLPVTEMILIQNWFEELKRLAPKK